MLWFGTSWIVLLPEDRHTLLNGIIAVKRECILYMYYALQREKTWQNIELTCAPNIDSNRPAHPNQSDQRFVVCMKKVCIFDYRNAHCEDSDQPAQMRRLIWIFAVRTCSKVRFWRRRSYYSVINILTGPRMYYHTVILFHYLYHSYSYLKNEKMN